MLLLCLVCAVVFCEGARIRGVAAENVAKYAGVNGMFHCFDSGKAISLSSVNDDFCDCDDGSDEPGTSACTRGQFFCANRGHEPKTIHSSFVDDGICDCCDGSDEAPGFCSNNCREVGEKARQERAKKLGEVREALIIRQTYLDKAKAELPVKRSRKEELAAKMAIEDSILEAVNLKKQGAEKEWRVANDEKELREKERGGASDQPSTSASDKPKDDFEKDDDDDDEDDGTAKAATEPTTTTLPIQTPPPAHDRVYGYYSDEGLEKKASELKAVMDEANKVYSDQVAVKDAIKRELDELEALFAHSLVGEHQMYGIFHQCFSKQITEYNYNLCWMDKAEQSGTLLGKFTSYKRDGAQLILSYEGGARCWGGEARSATVFVSCGSVNEIVSVNEPNRCQYQIQFTSPTACTQAQLDELQKQVELDNALLNEEQEEVVV